MTKPKKRRVAECARTVLAYVESLARSLGFESAHQAMSEFFAGRADNGENP